MFSDPRQRAMSGPSEDDSDILPEPAPPDPTLNIVGSPITSPSLERHERVSPSAA